MQDPDLDLEDLMAESVGKPMQAEPEDPEAIDLDDLLAESVGAVKAKREVEDSRRRLRQSGSSTSALAREDLDRIRQWEATNSWRPETLCAVFTETTCELCSSTRRVFTSLMVKEQSRQSAFARRWVAVGREGLETHHNLRRETGLIRASTVMCEECAPGLEWDLTNPVEISR